MEALKWDDVIPQIWECLPLWHLGIIPTGGVNEQTLEALHTENHSSPFLLRTWNLEKDTLKLKVRKLHGKQPTNGEYKKSGNFIKILGEDSWWVWWKMAFARVRFFLQLEPLRGLGQKTLHAAFYSSKCFQGDAPFGRLSCSETPFHYT